MYCTLTVGKKTYLPCLLRVLTIFKQASFAGMNSAVYICSVDVKTLVKKIKTLKAKKVEKTLKTFKNVFTSMI